MSVWKVRNKEWVLLPAHGALGGVVIIWDALKFGCLKLILGYFSVTIKLNSNEGWIF